MTDMQMPGMNGLELVAKLRKDDIQIPVILDDAAAGSEDLATEAVTRRSLELCLEAFIIEPAS